MKRDSVLFFGFSCLFAFGVLSAGCSGDSNTSATPDGGKDTAGRTGGSGGGTAGTGGVTGSGGSTSSGGATSSGGSVGAGGASQAGGAVGAGGATGNGGMSGTGGSTANDGGTQPDLPPGDDAVDAPLPGTDVWVGDDVPGVDSGTPILVDSGTLDAGGIDAPAIDTAVVLLDAGRDQDRDQAPDVDVSEAGVRLDGGHDAGSCLEQIVAAGYSVSSTNSCSLCRDTTQVPATNLSSQCEGMINCVAAHACTTQDTGDNCWIQCRNAIANGNQIATWTCAAALVTAACP